MRISPRYDGKFAFSLSCLDEETRGIQRNGNFSNCRKDGVFLILVETSLCGDIFKVSVRPESW